MQTDEEITTELAALANEEMAVGFNREAVALQAAIQEQWPRSHESYWLQIERRYRLYKIPADLALAAVRAGYSSPSTAINAGHIGKEFMIESFDFGSIRRASDMKTRLKYD
jgi:hypothetical protein